MPSSDTEIKSEGYTCSECGFALWNPVCQLDVSFLGIYNDARFPGRSILALNEHIEHWEDIPSSLLAAYAADSQKAIRAISRVARVARVNLAVLGNTDAHVHYHLIPRYPESESLPNKSPWNDPRPQEKMDRLAVDKLVLEIAEQLA
jgi:diadenosine tetraphosphate (Ap4A) HIT family hydrolase